MIIKLSLKRIWETLPVKEMTQKSIASLLSMLPLKNNRKMAAMLNQEYQQVLKKMVIKALANNQLGKRI